MKTDPIHFFNARGKHILTMEDQGAEIARLNARIEQLESLLNKASKQLRLAGRQLEERNSEKAH